MLVSSFDYTLPDGLIAQAPAPRGASRLMVLDRSTGAIRHSVVSELAAHLRRGDLLVVNNTRVFAARLLGRRVPSGPPQRGRGVGDPGTHPTGQPTRGGGPGIHPTAQPTRGGGPGIHPTAQPTRGGGPGGGAVECLLLARAAVDDGQATSTAQVWDALMHPGQKLRPGTQVRFEGDAGALMAEVLERRFYGRRVIRLWSASAAGVNDLIDMLGHVPLPPYIKRPDTDVDRERYQTVYASVRGSVAAPTAGLHFTPQLLEALAGHGVDRAEITLHVGYGTFKPVRVDLVEQHEVDAEPYVIPGAAADAINRARAEGRRVVAVGTTTTRALEAAAIRDEGRVVAGSGEATTFIYPGFRFQVVDALLTNFHLPRSSLLILVSAFAGRERVLAAYAEAVAHGYRFYSYGDAMLIL